MLSPQREAAALIEQAAAKCGSAKSKEEKSMNAALLILHVVMGLGIAAHGARKLFGSFAVGGINATGAHGKDSNDLGLF